MQEKIKLCVMDVDGTLTDGKVYIGEHGEVMKAFDIKDGLGVHDILPSVGIQPVIITGRESQALVNRCRELNIQHVYQGISDKVQKLEEIIREFSLQINEEISMAAVAYIGDDINDLPCMQQVIKGGGVVGCPSDAVLAVREIADFTCKKEGGSGAVREFIEWICN